MTTFMAKADKITSSSIKKYSMFIGRWQPWHDGHRWLIDQRLNEGKNVLVCVREVIVDEQNPFTTEQIVNMLEKELESLINEERVRIMIIPDIESVNYGRGVGYDVIEHEPPQHVKEISATKIRKEMRQKGLL